MLRSLMALILSVALLTPVFAQTSETGGSGGLTGGAPPASITERQNALQQGEGSVASGLDYSAAGIARQLGAGAGSDEVFRALRYGTPQVYVSDKDPEARVLIQTGGMRWLEVREGPLLTYGGYFLLGVLVLLVLFFLIRGRVKIAHGRSGRTMLRFTFIERFSHWLLAGSFIVLAITGLFLLFGREYLIETMGHEAYAQGALAAKWVHNNISWAFMLGLVMVFFCWVWNNLPARGDWTWIKQGGGLLNKNLHPPAKKFNAGQKMIFWTTIIFGASISATGLSLLFPFELPMFAKTFEVIQATGVPGLFGYTLPTTMAPHEEMQFAQLWHSIMSFVMIAIIIAHIYIGSIGMQGAFAAMGSGHVDVNWAREHHSIWAAKKEAKGAVDNPPGAQPAPAE
ncbi:MAG: formate dehydrogenase subunit gamma [Pseudomonadota bacterium]